MAMGAEETAISGSVRIDCKTRQYQITTIFPYSTNPKMLLGSGKTIGIFSEFEAYPTLVNR
ncbi:hypothetical protein ACFL2Q_16740 [Thermodesulfobacteriota bacterium]